jgi:8-oxo-dGTP pyrophosphatase MutT (NUDIX family)
MWRTHVTVAAVIEKNQHFVLVTDSTSLGYKLNQPAGHVEPEENFLQAIIREVKEEASIDFVPEKIIGLYWYRPNPQNNYLRICFKGHLKDETVIPRPSSSDDGVVAANWYSLADIIQREDEHRSNLVMRCINDYLAGIEFPLEVLANFRDQQEVYFD